MKNLLFILLLFSELITVQAQDVHIFYDVTKDSISYKQDGKTIEKLFVREGQQAILHLTNFNDYLYDVRVQTSTENYFLPGAGAISGSGGGSGLFGQFQQILGGGGSIADILGPAATGGSRDGAFDTQAAGMTQEMQNLSSKYQQKLQEIQLLEEEIIEIEDDIVQDLQSQEFSLFLQKEVFKLQHNPNLAPNRIKAMTMEYIERILDLNPRKPFELDDLMQRSKTREALTDEINSYELQVNKMDLKRRELNGLNELAQALSYADEQRMGFANTYELVEKNTLAYQEKASQMRAQLPAVQDLDIEKLAEVRYLYEEMKDHSFERTLVIQPDADITRMAITLIPKDSLNVQGLHSRRLNPVQLETYGGLKVNASVGVSFAGYFEQPQAYLVRDGQILGDELDLFQPIITSFVHFYSQGRRNLTVGGSFGIGISLGGENGGLPNYFLGPSLIAGKSQRVVLTTGLMGGKVTRLAEGYDVGDAYTEQIIPTKSVYEMGYFLGVSFNLMN